LADWAPAQPLCCIPEFVPQVIATVLGELGDLSRFADARQAPMMAGLNLTQSSSVHHQGQTHIAKRGRPAVRGHWRVLLSLERKRYMKHGPGYDAARLFLMGEVSATA
jgi:transposase